MEDQVAPRSDGRTPAAAAGAAQRAAARLQPGERRPRTQVLLERKGRQPGQMIGKSPWLQSVHLETDARDRRPRRGRARVGRPEQPCRRRLRQQDGRLMAAAATSPPSAEPRARLEIEFEQPHLLGPLFGEFDRNLVAIEDRLGVYIAARGNQGADRGRARGRGARPRRADRPLQPARPGPGHRRRGGRRAHRHVGPADPRRDHRGRGRRRRPR